MMASFTALNVEPESDVEEDIDDSKELQVEEALKLYQNALKLHAQGPAFYVEAEEAYDALFASEIFKYPEAQSEAKRLAQLSAADAEEIDGQAGEHGVSSSGAASGAKDAAPSTLPQILYLAYKNHGQFLVDRLAHHIALERQRNPGFLVERDSDTKEAAKESLDFFAEALDRDETDSDLWRRTARISRLLGSRRISRFCLEAVLNSAGGNDVDSWLQSARLEQTFARSELRALLDDVQDSLSEEQIGAALKTGKKVSASLARIMDPFPQLPLPSSEVVVQVLPEPTPIKLISVKERSWSSIGRAILEAKKRELRDGPKVAFGTGYHLSVSGGRERSAIAAADGRNSKKSPATNDSPKKEDAQQLDLPTEKDLQEAAVVIEEFMKDTETLPVVVASQDKGDAAAESEDGIATETINNEVVVRSPVEEKTTTRALSFKRESLQRPSLKRNSESAGLQEGGDGPRSRSKRLRARTETTAAVEEEVDPKEMSRHFEEQLQANQQADAWAFKILHGIGTKLGIAFEENVVETRQRLWPESESPDVSESKLLPMGTAYEDFKDCLDSWDLNKSNLVLHGSGSGASVTLIDAADDSGLASFLEHSKPVGKKAMSEQKLLVEQGISDFVEAANTAWMDISQVTMHWVESLLKPRHVGSESNAPYNTPKLLPSRYIEYVWPTSLKEILFQLVVEEDYCIFPQMEKAVADLDAKILGLLSTGATTGILPEEEAFMEVVQALFEVHLDIYGKITNASSKVDQPTRIQQRDRMRRWASLASQAVGKYAIVDGPLVISLPLTYRYLWSTVIYVSLIDSSSREHVLLCLQDLKHVLEDAGSPSYSLPNSMVMPEISANAADREISRLTTMDFFLGIFDPNTDDPVAAIESLEPILVEHHAENATTVRINGTSDRLREVKDSQEDGESVGSGTEMSRVASRRSANSERHQMSDFLSKASASLRLSLWHRLKVAYEAIEYSPMVFLCNIRSMEIILAELGGAAYSKEAKEDRSANLMVWMRNLSDIITHCIDLIRTTKNALDCMDEEHLSIAVASSASVLKLFHVFALWEDSVRVGQSQVPTQASGAAVAYKSAMNFLRDMQAKCWILQYHLLKDGAIQNASTYANSKEDLAEYLVAVHNTFGLREYCRIGKKMFLKLMKTELINLKPTGNWEIEMAQVVYDLYGLKICAHNAEIGEHGCNADQIDRGSALELVEPLMTQANRMNIKDVLRSEIKVASEKMQAVIGTPRANSTHQAFNRRLILSYLKSPINPLDLYRSLKGIGGLSGMPVRTDYAAVANKKWFFLQGNLLLARYRSQKRTSPDSSNDLDDAITFFKLDLEFDTESWETWFRLGQTYDAKLDEETTWSADKLNDPKAEIVALQKNVIHCYQMAVTVAVRQADDSFATAEKLSELYTDFGNRVYASSREPFSMKAFSLQDCERYFNGAEKGTYKREPFRDLKEPAAWLFASELFRLACFQKPDHWINWYMLGKCLWKMYRHPMGAITNHQEPLNAFIKAVEYAPEKRDNRHSDKDPILEPHYKLVSIVHKLVHSKQIQPDEGSQILAFTPHSRKARYEDFEDWDHYVLSVLKHLRSVDKANWHHRMVARAAHVLYDDNPNDPMMQHAAKHELNQQIFTKTMAIQVWKPEFERSGRHFVYTTRYIHFFVQLLLQIGDRSSMELLAKRVRRKQGDFIDHPKVWQEVCLAYLKLTRIQGEIPTDHEDTVFKSQLTFEAFARNAARLEAWAHSQLSLGNKTLDLLREIIELKKLNGTLMKPGPIDDLMCDTYARIYELEVPGLAAKADEAENRDRMRIDRMLMNDDNNSPAPESGAATAAENGQTATGRPKAIGRTEVRRRAEALVARLTTNLPVVRGRPAVSSPTVSRLGPAAIARRSLGVNSGLNGHKEVVSSVPGSVHDSADDESELTEIGDDDEEGEEGDGPEGAGGEPEVEVEAEGEDGAAEEQQRTVNGKAKTPLFPGLVGRIVISTIDGTAGDAAGEADQGDGEEENQDEAHGQTQADAEAENTTEAVDTTEDLSLSFSANEPDGSGPAPVPELERPDTSKGKELNMDNGKDEAKNES